MKKTFKLHVEGKNSDRLLEAIKHEVRKYLKRERRKTLPAGVDYWDFNCKFGLTESSAQEVHLAEIIKKMDEVSRSGGDGFYVEILAAHGVRQRRPSFAEPRDQE
jgi:hypothetical protein